MSSPEYAVLVQFSANLPTPDTLTAEELQIAAYEVLRQNDAPEDSYLSLIISTDEHLQDLNEKYRGINVPTDVLSFPSDPLPQGVGEEDEGGYLGDVIIGLPYVVRRAVAEGHELKAEIKLLVVHGVLHLLGYDHDTPENQSEMWALQAQALSALGIRLDVPDYIHARDDNPADDTDE